MRAENVMYNDVHARATPGNRKDFRSRSDPEQRNATRGNMLRRVARIETRTLNIQWRDPRCCVALRRVALMET